MALQSQPNIHIHPTRAHLIDSYVQNLADTKQFSGTVLVAHGRNLVLEKGYGIADYNAQIKNDISTKFRIASITKQCTAAAILRLQEKGMLSVQDTIAHFIPDFPHGDTITLHHLLTHSSGLVNYTSLEAYWQTATIEASPAQTIARFQHLPLCFATGSQATYSNSGYVLLADIIERVTGKTFIQFLTDEFFEPLGMHDTGFASQKNISADFAIGYRIEDGNAVLTQNVDMMQQSGAGFLYSTVRDLLIWHRALQSGRVLTPESLHCVETPHMPGLLWGSPIHFGYGVFVGKLLGARHIYHHGAIKGFMSTMSRFPDEDVCIILLSNIERCDIDGMVKHIAQLVFND